MVVGREVDFVMIIIEISGKSDFDVVKEMIDVVVKILDSGISNAENYKVYCRRIPVFSVF